MATAKLGQIASNQINDLAQKHWDVDMKIRDTMSTASLDVKMRLATRLPAILSEIDAELKRVEIPTA